MRVPNACYTVLAGDDRVHFESRVSRRFADGYSANLVCGLVVDAEHRRSRHVRIDAALRAIARVSSPGHGPRTCRGCLPFRNGQ